uniref:SAP domain-containing protein n=1 Tax=viral metagenome TaxID=1070528 RepID=A0A6C0CKS1_9ZZZZ
MSVNNLVEWCNSLARDACGVYMGMSKQILDRAIDLYKLDKTQVYKDFGLDADQVKSVNVSTTSAGSISVASIVSISESAIPDKLLTQKEYESYSFIELRRHCTALKIKLPKAPKKPEFIKLITEYYEKQAELNKLETMSATSNASLKPSDKVAAVKTISENRYNSQNLTALRAECGRRGLVKSGKKADVINRLVVNDELQHMKKMEDAKTKPESERVKFIKAKMKELKKLKPELSVDQLKVEAKYLWKVKTGKIKETDEVLVPKPGAGDTEVKPETVVDSTEVKETTEVTPVDVVKNKEDVETAVETVDDADDNVVEIVDDVKKEEVPEKVDDAVDDDVVEIVDDGPVETVDNGPVETVDVVETVKPVDDVVDVVETVKPVEKKEEPKKKKSSKKKKDKGKGRLVPKETPKETPKEVSSDVPKDAPKDPPPNFDKMVIKELTEWLKKEGLDHRGTKPELINRCKEYYSIGNDEQIDRNSVVLENGDEIIQIEEISDYSELDLVLDDNGEFVQEEAIVVETEKDKKVNGYS